MKAKYILKVTAINLFVFLDPILGALGGWILCRKKTLVPLSLEEKERILVVASHPDDEILGLGGLLAFAFKRKIAVKIIYLTCGDAYFPLKRKRFFPSSVDFINGGKLRAKEAKEAVERLGGEKENLTFFGYPDSGLKEMWLKKKDLIAGPMTEKTASPYRFSFKKGRGYRGENLIADLTTVVNRFKPTMVFVNHEKDTSPDHWASHLFTLEVLKKTASCRVFQYLISYNRPWRFFPAERRLGEKKKTIFPPFTLGGGGSWFNFSLSPKELEKKKFALQAHKSQLVLPVLKRLFRLFSAQNEIFQLKTFQLKEDDSKSSKT